MSSQHEGRWFLMWLTGFVLAIISTYASAQEDTVPDEPTLTVRLSPASPYLQEEIVQIVRVISPHPFEELVLDLPPVDGAEMITLQQPRNRKFETYGGEGYLYETSRAIFPRQSGELRMPPVRISGSVGIGRREKKPFVLREDAKVLDVRPPPAAFSEDWWLVAETVEIDESWSVPLETLRVGDRVTRSIAVTIEGATGAHLPELEQGRSNGLTVLPGQTERRTEITPDGVVGIIQRSFDIRIDADQPINISPVRVVWWHSGTETERRSAARATRIEPLPRDVDGLVSSVMAEAAEARRTSQRAILIVTLISAMLTLGLIIWLVQARRNVSPADRTLEKALNADPSPISALRALSIWAETSFPENQSLTLEQLGERLGPDAEAQIAVLQRSTFGAGSEPTDARAAALEIMRLAQAERSRTRPDIINALLDRVLGPETKLPVIYPKSD